ncbi:heavy metal-associated isoprenylated plant protein 19 [Brassica rapa]|uniref:heavy metal-associated isoprenylated plant protein 19 n=1 Tax=Brassica campestris TaxID=3711 RepID=UPI00142E915D|nr:heavy metal-associated isoprenylated plant protein 19 [Brassica rapa]XP_048632735.1 heavy metal-associated isoprenylated plant protein 19-like [Brassica napus]
MFKKIMFTTHYSSIFSSTLDVELKIPDCNKCEKGMIAVISNFKGVESYTKDTENQKVAVSGSFDLEKLLKKLKKVTGGKGVEVVKEEEKDPEPEIVEVVKEKDEETEVVQEVKTEENARPEVVFEPNSDEQKEKEKYMLFSDENPNAKCTIS